MRPIDADFLKEWVDEYLSVFKKYDIGAIKGFVDHAPTIDVVPKDFHDKTCEAMAKRHTEEMQRYMWIPCSERLPEEDICDSYLIAWIPANEKVKCGLPHYYQVADWEDGDWTNLDFCGHEEIIILAWMPLPEPYKESE